MEVEVMSFIFYYAKGQSWNFWLAIIYQALQGYNLKNYNLFESCETLSIVVV